MFKSLGKMVPIVGVSINIHLFIFASIRAPPETRLEFLEDSVKEAMVIKILSVKNGESRKELKLEKY